MRQIHLARLGPVLAGFLAISGCDKIDIRTIEIQPQLVRTFIRMDHTEDKSWWCSVPPAGICTFGTGEYTENLPDKKGFNVGYHFKKDTKSVGGSCNCDITFKYKAMHLAGIVFKSSDIKPKLISSAKLVFKDGIGFNVSSAGSSTKNDFSFKSINLAQDEWLKLPASVGDQSHEFIDSLPKVGDVIAEVDWTKPFLNEATQTGQVAKKGDVYSFNITKIVEFWRDNPANNQGLFVVPTLTTFPAGYPYETSANIGNFSDVKLVIVFNAKAKENQ